MPSIFKKICKCCKKCYNKSYFAKHLKTKKHKKNQQKNKKIIDEATLFPTDILNIIMDYKEDIEKHQEIFDIIESINNDIEKKVRRKSNRVYSRNIKLRQKIKFTTIIDIFNVNLNYISRILKTDEDETDEDILIKELSIQYIPTALKDKFVIFFN